MSTTEAKAKTETSTRRIGIFDVIKGFTLISMVLFHLCYDLAYIKGLHMPWFSGTLMVAWQRSIAWVFLFIAGISCTLSRNNLKRAGVYAVVALGVFLVTWIVSVDTPISFGIIYCMAACTFVWWCLDKVGLAPRGYVAAIVCFILFILLLDLPNGYVGIGDFMLKVPSAPYDCGFLSWAGFPAPSFSSGDYYPLLPYLFLYLSGASAGAVWIKAGYPDWAKNACLQPLNWLGQHTLVIYVIHQPLILAVLSLIP